MTERTIDTSKQKQLVTLYLTQSMFKRLKIAAEMCSRTRGDIIKEALYAWLEENEIPPKE